MDTIKATEINFDNPEQALYSQNYGLLTRMADEGDDYVYGVNHNDAIVPIIRKSLPHPHHRENFIFTDVTGVNWYPSSFTGFKAFMRQARPGDCYISQSKNYFLNDSPKEIVLEFNHYRLKILASSLPGTDRKWWKVLKRITDPADLIAA